MIVECLPEGGAQLREPFDFRRFKLVLKGGASAELSPWQGIAFVDDQNALIPIDLVPTLRGCPADESWHQAFAEMVMKAREHGWIDTVTNSIRAHVEQQP
ncbi:hypothetical protein E3H11_04525 [Bradyrhizobium brasilense]|uniref:hypothetical protein n=1 Tax=Bradyrhizobium brasilense TaxID=1419277 RepID=UPI0014563DEA|nr:hypothetical protein [Bradyrhizobium brasilense]NLS68197.1 hypothetical protein [Bradyrhizobium brasilense]